MAFYKGPGLANSVSQAAGEHIWGKNQARLLERVHGILKGCAEGCSFEIRRYPSQTDVTVLQVEGMRSTLFAWPEKGGWRIENYIPWED